MVIIYARSFAAIMSIVPLPCSRYVFPSSDQKVEDKLSPDTKRVKVASDTQDCHSDSSSTTNISLHDAIMDIPSRDSDITVPMVPIKVENKEVQHEDDDLDWLDGFMPAEQMDAELQDLDFVLTCTSTDCRSPTSSASSGGATPSLAASDSSSSDPFQDVMAMWSSSCLPDHATPPRSLYTSEETTMVINTHDPTSQLPFVPFC